MPIVVPSQIVWYIDTTLSDLVNARSVQNSVPLAEPACGPLNGLLRLIEQLPNYLLPSDPNVYADFIQNQESIRLATKRAGNHNFRGDGPLRLIQTGSDKRNHVQVIRAALVDCPDEVPPHHSKELPFIKDANFRHALLIDLEAARSALIHGEWKAATILAGALVEALLLWAIQQSSADVQKACSAALTAGKLHKSPPADPLNWGLHEFVAVAEQLTVIEPDTAKEATLAKDYRNLIHPGRSIRLQQSCDRGTALMANAAVEHVARDLVARFP